MAQLYTTGPAHLFISFVQTVLPPAANQIQLGGQRNPNNKGQVVKAGALGIPAAPIPGPLQYLGTAKIPPTIHLRPAYEPAYNQLGGRRIPFDVVYHGEEGFSFIDLNRFNEYVVAALQARPFQILGNRGINLPGDIGTLCLAEGGFVQLFMYFPYVNKPYFSAGLMPPGYRFPATVMMGPDQLKELGVDPRENQLVFWHLRTFDPSSGVFGCYDHAVGQMPAIN